MDRLREKLETGDDPGEIINELLGEYGKGPKRGKVENLKRIQNMGEWINKEGARLVEEAKKFNISTDLFKADGTGVTQVFADMRRDFDSWIFDALANQSKILATAPNQPSAIREMLKKLDPSQKTLLGITKEKEKYILQTSEDFAHMFDDDFMKALRAGDDDTSVSPFIKKIFDSDNFETDINRLILGGKVDKTKIKESIFQYLFDPNNGAAFTHNLKNSPYFDANKFYVNPEKLSDAVRKLLTSKKIKDAEILTEDDRVFLNAVNQLSMALQGGADPDAGVALAGAQIIGELFTIDIQKFFGGAARLAAQRRISELFTNDGIINTLAGFNETKKQVGFIQRAFFGYGALGDAVGKASLRGTFEEKEEDDTEKPVAPDRFNLRGTFSSLDQTDAMLKANRVSPQ